MPDDTFRFTPEQLNRLEQRLWHLIDTYSRADDHQFPPVESLLGPDDACDLYAETLHLYAIALIEHREANWINHPLLEHLTICTRCLETLNQTLIRYGETTILHHHRPDVNITIFEDQISDDDEVLRSVYDIHRPKLLSSGFMQHPSDWHYSLESLPQTDASQPSIRLTLATSDGNSGDIPVTLVLFGQVLQGITNDKGEVDFHPEVIPLANDPQTPVLNVHVHLSELEVS